MIFGSCGCTGPTVGTVAPGLAVMVAYATFVIAATNEDLVSAATRCDLSEVQRILAMGVDVNAKVKGGVTALMVASSNGLLAAVRALLAGGADVNAGSDDWVTALKTVATAPKTAGKNSARCS